MPSSHKTLTPEERTIIWYGRGKTNVFKDPKPTIGERHMLDAISRITSRLYKQNSSLKIEVEEQSSKILSLEDKIIALEAIIEERDSNVVKFSDEVTHYNKLVKLYSDFIDMIMSKLRTGI